MSCKLPCTYKYKLLLWKWIKGVIVSPPYSSQCSAGQRSVSVNLILKILFTVKNSALSWNVGVLKYIIKAIPCHSLLVYLLFAFKMLETPGFCPGLCLFSLRALFSGVLLQPSGSRRVSMPTSPKMRPQPWPSRCQQPTSNAAPPFKLRTGLSKLNGKTKIPDFRPHSCLPVHSFPYPSHGHELILNDCVLHLSHLINQQVCLTSCTCRSQPQSTLFSPPPLLSP